jgi:hypothetical protein
MEEQSFQDYIWPVLKDRIKPWPELSLEMLHIVLLARTLYPRVVKKKFLQSRIGTPEVIHEDSIESCAKILMVSDILLLSNGTTEHWHKGCWSYHLIRTTWLILLFIVL